MAIDVKQPPPSSLPLAYTDTDNDAIAANDAAVTQAARDTQATAPGDMDAILSAALGNLSAAGMLGVGSYGGTAAQGQSTSAGLGQVTFPASTSQAPNAGVVERAMAVLGNYGTAAFDNAGGAVGTSMVLGAENGASYTLPDSAGVSDSTLASAVMAGNTSALGGSDAAKDDATTTAPATTANTTSKAATQTSAATSTGSKPTVDNVNVISSNRLNTASLDDALSTDAQKQTGKTIEESDLAKQLTENGTETKKDKCHKYNRGEDKTIALLTSQYGISTKDAQKLSRILNPTAKNPMPESIRTNVTNLISTLGLLKERGDSKGAQKQIKEQLHTVTDTVDKWGKSTDGSTGSNDVAVAVGTAYSYVAQYALNPQLTSFTKPEETNSRKLIAWGS